jgi:hypothetical protein
VDVVKVLNKMISAIERPLRLRLVRALLKFVSCHVSIIRMYVATEWTRLEEGCLGIATNPCCSKCMYRVFVPEPFVFGFERCSCQVWHCTDMEQKSFQCEELTSWTEGTEEREILLWLARTVDSVELCTVVMR